MQQYVPCNGGALFFGARHTSCLSENGLSASDQRITFFAFLESALWDPLIATPPFCSIGTLCRCVTTADMWSQSHMYSVNYTTAEDPDAILQHCGQDDAGDRDHSCLK
jgi:hypothetical protein